MTIQPRFRMFAPDDTYPRLYFEESLAAMLTVPHAQNLLLPKAQTAVEAGNRINTMSEYEYYNEKIADNNGDNNNSNGVTLNTIPREPPTDFISNDNELKLLIDIVKNLDVKIKLAIVWDQYSIAIKELEECKNVN
mgnify:CR=1 FL=1